MLIFAIVMSNTMSPTKFELKPGFAPSLKELQDSLSDEKWNAMIKLVSKRQGCSCLGCGFKPVDESCLKLHAEKLADNPKNSDFMLLCTACYTIRHFDKAADLDMVVLVNSKYSQEDLIRRCRSSNKTIVADIENKRIMLLKKSAKEYAAELKDSELNRNDRTKVIFGTKFKWGKCR